MGSTTWRCLCCSAYWLSPCHSITLAVLVLIWGAYAMVDGVLALIAAYRVRDRGRPFWSLLIVGLLGIVAGVVDLPLACDDGAAAPHVHCGLGGRDGIFQIIAAIRLRKVIQNSGCSHCRACCRCSLASSCSCSLALAHSR